MPLKLTVSNIPLNAVSKIVSLKLFGYTWIFDCIEKNNGYFPYPEWLMEYFNQLGVEHWAEYYFQEKIAPLINEARSECDFFTKYIFDKYGPSPTNDQAIEALRDLSSKLADEKANFECLAFLENPPDLDSFSKLTQEEKDNQKNVLMTFQLGFYNDLAIAVHGESIYMLVHKAISENNIDALTKAIQIDRSTLSYFYKFFEQNSLKGDSDFFDTVAYRLKNPPARGKIKHPLLWILFKDLVTFACLHKGVTNKQILDLYNDSIKDFSQFIIDDEQTVQRQRRKFIKKYRLLKLSD